MEFRPLRYIGEAVEALFDRPPALEKVPGRPDGFVWRGATHRVVEMLSEWHDYGRHGRMAQNMRPEHAATASRRGSWGVGRAHFRVRTDGDRVFELYYDRSPSRSGRRKGGWFLFQEVKQAPEAE